MTALIAACRGGHQKVISYLLSRGADPKRYTQEGLTPLMALVIKENKGKVNPGMIIKAARELLDKGIQVDAVDRNGHTALMFALRDWGDRNFGLVKLLVDKKAGVNAKSYSEQKTPLMFAAQGGHIKCIKLLRKEGASIYDQDKSGHSAYDFLLQFVGADKRKRKMLSALENEKTKTVEGVLACYGFKDGKFDKNNELNWKFPDEAYNDFGRIEEDRKIDTAEEFITAAYFYDLKTDDARIKRSIQRASHFLPKGKQGAMILGFIWLTKMKEKPQNSSAYEGALNKIAEKSGISVDIIRSSYANSKFAK